MPLGINRSDINDGGTSYRNGSPVTTPINFGNEVELPVNFGNQPPFNPGNQVTWAPNPAHFGNVISSYPAPTFTSVSPNNGSTAGGTSITIVGSGFSVHNLEVLIGGNPCTGVSYSDDEHLTATTPAGTAGETDIEILTEGGSVDTPDAWTYTAQQATPTFSPAGAAYTTPQFLQFLSGGADAIYYTLDGSTPTVDSPQYYPGGHIVGIEANTTVKALATQTGYSNSDIGSAAYTFDLAPAFLRQSDAWGANDATTTFWSPYFEVERYPFLPVQAGDAIVLVFTVCGEGSAADINGMNITGVTDNYGNTWTQVPGARVSTSGFFAQFVDFWVAYNVAAPTADVAIQITATTDTAVGDSSSPVCVTVWDCVGLTGGTPTVATGSVSDSGGGFTGPSIDAGTSSIVISAYPYILAAAQGFGDVASPFNIYVSSSNANASTGPAVCQQVCSAVTSGTVAPVWSGLPGEGFTMVLSEVAFPTA